jgi:hypothetical protein
MLRAASPFACSHPTQTPSCGRSFGDRSSKYKPQKQCRLPQKGSAARHVGSIGAQGRSTIRGVRSVSIAANTVGQVVRIMGSKSKHVGAHQKVRFAWPERGPCNRCQNLRPTAVPPPAAVRCTGGAPQIDNRGRSPLTRLPSNASGPSSLLLRNTSLTKPEAHHLFIKLKQGRRGTAPIRAILDLDWSDSPRDWASRASTFIPPPAPEPVKFQRKRLDLKFAVLLMRSSYEAADELDFVAMNKFQVKVGGTARSLSFVSRQVSISMLLSRCQLMSCTLSRRTSLKSRWGVR